MIDIPGYNGRYKIDINGNVWSTKMKKFLRPWTSSHGYLYVRLCRNWKGKHYSIHRLLATAFIENKNTYPCINHIDGNKLNNKLDNLEWCTYSHNISEAYRLGLHANPKRNQKLDAHLVECIRNIGSNSWSDCKYLASIFDVGPRAIYNIINHKTWNEMS